uniref:Acetyltransferase-related family protein n=1 Tax=Rhizophora mucronata TaxID=61149 RepID=A0A2P2KD74_RHIMU
MHVTVQTYWENLPRHTIATCFSSSTFFWS